MAVNQVMIKSILESLAELMEDNTVPKNIKNRVSDIISLLKNMQDNPINISKALSVVEEISEDNNMQSYTRTQIYNIASALEAAQL